MVSLDEIIGQVNMMKSNFGKKINAGTNTGLYIEIKDYDWYLAEHGIDMAEQVYNNLKRHGLSTIAGCQNSIPIVI